MPMLNLQKDHKSIRKIIQIDQLDQTLIHDYRLVVNHLSTVYLSKATALKISILT